MKLSSIRLSSHPSKGRWRPSSHIRFDFLLVALLSTLCCIFILLVILYPPTRFLDVWGSLSEATHEPLSALRLISSEAPAGTPPAGTVHPAGSDGSADPALYHAERGTGTSEDGAFFVKNVYGLRQHESGEYRVVSLRPREEGTSLFDAIDFLGTLAKQKHAGYGSYIPSHVKLNRVWKEDRTLFLDFNEAFHNIANDTPKDFLLAKLQLAYLFFQLSDVDFIEYWVEGNFPVFLGKHGVPNVRMSRKTLSSLESVIFE